MHKIILLVSLIGVFTLWAYKGIAETGIHVDLARDLNELSNLWVHQMVWLGPMTSANFPASPIYYYLLFPGLYLSGGNGLSIVVSHAFFALLALGVFAYFQLKKSLASTVLVILTIGLSGWWIRSSSLPWNGHMYVAWVFLALTSLYFKKPIFISTLLFGTAIAIDLAAVLALPVLFYEWWAAKERLKKIIYISLGLLIPWAPIIIFEIITKGFLIRQWLEYPSGANLFYSPNTANITSLLNIIGLSQTAAIAILLVCFLIGSNRQRFWILFASLPLIFLALVSPLRQYYLLGLVCVSVFTIVTILSANTIGKVMLVIFILLSAQAIRLPPLIFASRSIPSMDNLVSKFIQQSNLDKSKKYAVVNIRDLQNSTPQADDYRFFLRMKGINVLNIDQYPQADMLLLFVEVANFDWLNFEDWHMQRFGSRKLLSSHSIDGVEIIIYEKPKAKVWQKIGL